MTLKKVHKIKFDIVLKFFFMPVIKVFIKDVERIILPVLFSIGILDTVINCVTNLLWNVFV